MFQLISILIVLVLVAGGIYSAYTYFIAEKESAGSPKTEPTTTTPVADAILISNPAPTTSTVNPQITDAVTQAPKKTKKKRYYHSKPKAKTGAKPARFKQTLSKKNLDKIKRVKGK